MDQNILDDIIWYQDSAAIDRGELGIYHSYLASLATALNYLDRDFDPVSLMGSSAFAFRIFVNETMCPSAMSIFDWSTILPEAVEQAGYECLYIDRMWGQKDIEADRKAMAQSAIIEAIDKGIPAIVWDIFECEWGLIIGYDMKAEIYTTLTSTGQESTLPFAKLGRNGINVLSVAIPIKPNARSSEKIITKALSTAVAHAEQKEWNDRPQYQNGLEAYQLWSVLYDRWVMLTEAGKSGNIGTNIVNFARYYAGHHYSARSYAREYLRMIAAGNDALLWAAESYRNVAHFLKTVWDISASDQTPDIIQLKSCAENIRNARKFEAEGIEFIKEFLSR